MSWKRTKGFTPSASTPADARFLGAPIPFSEAGEGVTMWDAANAKWANLDLQTTYVALYSEHESRLRRLLRHIPIVNRRMGLPRRKTIYESPVKDVEPGEDALTISWSVSGFTYARGNVSPGSITGVGTVAPTGVDDENPDV